MKLRKRTWRWWVRWNNNLRFSKEGVGRVMDVGELLRSENGQRQLKALKELKEYEKR